MINFFINLENFILPQVLRYVRDYFQVPAGTNSRRSSRGVSQQPPDEPMRRSMSLASQQEVPRYQDDESSYASQSPAGRRASEANYSSPSRYDTRSSNGVSIEESVS